MALHHDGTKQESASDGLCFCLRESTLETVSFVMRPTERLSQTIHIASKRSLAHFQFAQHTIGGLPLQLPMTHLV
jgi:hypothetical protein